MDPQACLERVLQAWDYGDGEEFTYACEDLAQWLDRGGFVPTMPSNPFGDRVVRARCRTWGFQRIANIWHLVRYGSPCDHETLKTYALN